MNKALTENWNSVVKPEDTVFHLGDFAFGGISKFLPYLNGNITLIRGNHDRDSDIRGCGLLIHQNLDFDYGGYHFKMNHRPVFESGTPDPFRDAETRSLIKLKDYDYILCGHVHEKWINNGKNINVGTDVWDFKPLDIDALIQYIELLKNGEAI